MTMVISKSENGVGRRWKSLEGQAFSMQIAFETAGAWGLVTSDTTNGSFETRPSEGSPEAAHFLAASQWAYRKIAQRVGQEELDRVQSASCNDARGAWEALRSMHVPSGYLKTVDLSKRLAHLKANSSAELGDLVRQHTAMIAEAASAKFAICKPSDADMLIAYNTQIPRGLSSTWAAWRTAISGREGLASPRLEYPSYIKNELKSRALHGEVGASLPEQTTIVSQHEKALLSRLRPKGATQSGSAEKKCYECGGTGHIKTNCPNTKCYNCQENGHTASKCPGKESGAQPATAAYDNDWHATAYISHTSSNGPPKSNTWIADSGASAHMTHTRALLQDIKERRVRVAIGDGRVLYSTHVGSIILNFAGIDPHSFHEVLLVPELDINLFSPTAITKAGSRYGVQTRNGVTDLLEGGPGKRYGHESARAALGLG